MATYLPTAEPVPLAQRITSGLTKIHLALRNQAWRTNENHSVAPAQRQILLLLRSRPHRAPTVSDIAEYLTVTPGSASLAIRGLAESGLVRKSRSGPDARHVTLALTAKGRRRADSTLKWSDFLARAAETLTVPDQEALLRTLLKILLILHERGEIPAIRMCLTCRHFRPNVHAASEQSHQCAMLDAPFGDALLRIDCPAHDPARPEERMTSRPTRTLRGEIIVRPTGRSL
jgi:DNA-binding MarR family transcriptional regulator